MAVRLLLRWGPVTVPIPSAKAAPWLGLGTRAKIPSPPAGRELEPVPHHLVCGSLSLQGNQPGDNRGERRGDKEGKAGPLRDMFSVGGCHLSGIGTPAEGVLGPLSLPGTSR